MAVTLKAMQYFTTALRHGNIAQAAAELNVAASAVSSAISGIEATFGLTLVTRHRARGIAPTASGRSLARRFENLLDDYHAILRSGASMQEAAGGHLRLGYYAPVAPAFLPPILARMGLEPGALSLHLEACDNDTAQAGLQSGLFDAVLFVSDDVRPAIRYEVLIEAPAFCLMPTDHKLSAQRDVSLSEIAAEPLVLLNRPVAGPYYRGLFDATEQKPMVAAQTNSAEMVRTLVGAGHGLSILNMRPLSAATYAGDLVTARPIRDVLRPLSLAIGYDTAEPRPLVRRFAEVAKAHFAEEAEMRRVIL